MRKFTEKLADQCIVIGCSAGGIDALRVVFANLTTPLSVPIIVVQHVHSSMRHINYQQLFETSLPIVEAEDKSALTSGMIFFAPANYHLLIERHGAFALSSDDPVNFSRPSIDMLFLSAARAYGSNAVGIILSGANSDGAVGLAAIQSAKGHVLVQTPSEAQFSEMPLAALEQVGAKCAFNLTKIVSFINSMLLNKTEIIPI